MNYKNFVNEITEMIESCKKMSNETYKEFVKQIREHEGGANYQRFVSLFLGMVEEKRSLL